MRKALIGLAAMAALAGSVGAAQAATVLGVEEGCGKSSCFNDSGVFTKTFSAGAFNGPVNVTQLLLDRGVLGALDGQTFRISFQLNGAELGTWGKYNMGGIGGDQLSFAGESFVWNPEAGDLVLVLELVPPPKPGAGGFLMARGAPTEEGFAPEPDGPVTNPERPIGPPGPQVGVVPEPSTWALMIGGFGFAGAMIRRRRAVFATQP